MGASSTRTRSRAGSGSTPSTRAVNVTIAGRASTGAATLSARHHASPIPNAAVSAPIASARLARSCRASAIPVSPSAPSASIATNHCAGCSSTNQAVIPAPSATGSHSGS